MNIDNMTYGELKKIDQLFREPHSELLTVAPHLFIGKYVIAR